MSAVEGLNFFPKTWGYELVFANNEEYCGKKLFVKNGLWSSDGNFHYHKKKDETFFVIEGILKLDFCRTENYYDLQSISLYPGDFIRLLPYTRHRFTSISNEPLYGCKFIEVSTTDEETDSYRCYFDINLKEWVEYDPKTLDKKKT